MGTELRIRCVSLEHADLEHSWRFPDGVTVIVGASGGGKSPSCTSSTMGSG